MEQLETKTEEQRRRRPKPRRDWLLPASLVAAVLLIAAVIVPVIQSTREITRYRNFIGDLAESIAYGADSGALVLDTGEEERAVTNIQAEDLLIVIARSGQGKPNKTLPKDEGLLLTFGDGSTLRLCPIRQSGTERPEDAPTHVHYTGRDGKVYAYDTDQIVFRTVLRTLGLPWQG